MRKTFFSIGLVKSLILIALFFVSSTVLLTYVRFAHADDGLSVTVTPPLIQLSIGPGESWTSVLKIVNNNSYDVTYYTQLVDMQAQGEDGRSRFIPLINEPQNDPAYQTFALARWIQLSSEPIPIKAGATGLVPFTVHIPSNAEPGGHYAAILIGTQPGSFNQPGNMMKISSYVSSLIFVEIKGNALESGRIREFSTAQSLYQTPTVDFTVRFENTGNTHVHPQGSVTIYNMWGKQRGQVMINNQDADFGNVLPDSIRRFQFSWQAEQNLFDIGPYSAVVTLNYGSDSKKSVSATAYFWIVPLVPVSIGLGSITLFIILVTWLIRRYIRRALMLEKLRFDRTIPHAVAPIHAPVIEALMEPIREGVIDLRSMRASQGQISKTHTSQSGVEVRAAIDPIPVQSIHTSLSFAEFIRKYRLFFVFIVVCMVISLCVWWYFVRVLDVKRGYQISNVIIQSEPVSTQ